MIQPAQRTRHGAMASVSVLDAASARAASDPESVAVVAPDHTLTYAELMAWARSISRRLAQFDLHRDEYILVQGARSAATLAAMLGVWRAGGAFIVLDAEMSPERLGAVADGVRPRAAIGSGPAYEQLRARGIPTVEPDAAADELVDDQVHDPIGVSASRHGIDDLAADSVAAYAVLTSGSTGTPKAVVVEHGHLSAYVRGVLERLNPPAPAVWACLTPLWADLCYTVVFGSLASGGTLLLVPVEASTSAERMASTFTARPADVMKTTPSHLSALLTGRDPRAVLPRWLLILGGERLPWSLVRRVRAIAPELRIVNHYGPAECTIGVAAGDVPPEPAPGCASAPVGPALPGVHLFLLDVAGMPVAAGEVGEIYASGVTVARGYLNDDQSTGARFADVVIGGSGRRCYRTGDLARELDGQMEIIGRTDRQVKISGFRVEPGEIEHGLSFDPRVRDAHAFAVPGPDGSVAMAAAVTLNVIATESELLDRLRARISAPALPQRILVMDALPVIAAGKVNDGELIDALSRSAESTDEPRTSTETVVAKLWSGVLGRSVGRVDNVFHRGANSIAAIRFLAGLHEALDVEVPLYSIFEEPTVAGIAALVDEKASAAAARDTGKG